MSATTQLREPCTCQRSQPSLRFERLDVEERPLTDSSRDVLHWTLFLEDDRLPEGATYLHVATGRTGYPFPEQPLEDFIRHVNCDGMYHGDPVTDFDGVGLPVDDRELLELLRRTIEDHLRVVDTCRALLIHWPPRPLRQAA